MASHKKKYKKKFIVLLIFGLFLAASGGALYPLVDYIIKTEITKRVIISNTSELYDIWQDIPVPVYMQFYMYNVSNSIEIKKGEKPYLNQIGPYTYRERRVKFDIVWNSNGTVTYRQNRTFTFIPETSVGKETDLITTINPLVAVVAQSFQWMPEEIRTVVSDVMEYVEAEDLFVTRPVSELLWGYDDPTLITLNKILPAWFSSTQIGYFIRKNYTDDGLYTVFTGETNINDVGRISTFNGRSHETIWTTEWANELNGTDGTLGPPLSFDLQQSSAFVSDLCRSITGLYKGITQTPQGIKLHRFVGNFLEMANITINPDNIGFCTPVTRCLPSGLLNGTLCIDTVDGFRIPVIFSFPHFLYADQEVLDSVLGLHPNEEEHGTAVDSEPYTGLVLQVAKRLQVNIFVEQIEGIKQTAQIRKLYFPILWMNESSVTDDKHAKQLKDELLTPIEIADISKIVLCALGGFLVLLGVMLLTRQRLSWKRLPDTPAQYFNVGAPIGPHAAANLYIDPSMDSSRSSLLTSSVLDAVPHSIN